MSNKNIFRYESEDENTLEKMMHVFESLNTLPPLANSLSRLSFTASVTMTSNKRPFSKLKINFVTQCQ